MINRSTKYPGRFELPTAQNPLGAFKNRTTNASKDGSYLEKDWLNDWAAFFSSITEEAGVTANDTVDEVGASQIFDSLLSVTRGTTTTLFQDLAGIGDNVVVDFSGTGFETTDFDLILLRGLAENNATGGGGAVFALLIASQAFGTAQIAIGETSRSGGTEGYSFAGCTFSSTTQLTTQVVESGVGYTAVFVGVYGIKL